MKDGKSHNPWRYRCPAGHTNWLSTATGYHCESCAEHGGDYETFDELVDMKEKPLKY